MGAGGWCLVLDNANHAKRSERGKASRDGGHGQYQDIGYTKWWGGEGRDDESGGYSRHGGDCCRKCYNNGTDPSASACRHCSTRGRIWGI